MNRVSPQTSPIEKAAMCTERLGGVEQPARSRKLHIFDERPSGVLLFVFVEHRRDGRAVRARELTDTRLAVQLRESVYVVSLSAVSPARESRDVGEGVYVVAPAPAEGAHHRAEALVGPDDAQSLTVDGEKPQRQRILARVFQQLADHSVRVGSDRIAERDLVSDGLADREGVIPHEKPDIRALLPHIQQPRSEIADAGGGRAQTRQHAAQTAVGKRFDSKHKKS